MEKFVPEGRLLLPSSPPSLFPGTFVEILPVYVSHDLFLIDLMDIFNKNRSIIFTQLCLRHKLFMPVF